MKRFSALALAIICGALPAFADTTNELAVARQALRDGLWAIAEHHATLAAEDPAIATDAHMVILEALSRNGRAGDMVFRLNSWSDSNGEGYRYWRAWASAANGFSDEAIRILKGSFKSPQYQSLAARLGARVSVEKGDRASAEQFFRLAAETGDASEKSENALEWARALRGFGDVKAAISVLETSKAVIGTEIGDETAIEKASDHAALGENDKAAALWQSIIAAGDKASEHAFVVAGTEYSKALYDSGKTNEAVLVATAAYERAKDVDLRMYVGFTLGFELLPDSATRERGVKIIKEMVRCRPESPDARNAQLRLADTLLSLRDTTAEREYQVFLETYPEAALDSAVLEGRGWALLQLGKSTEAVGLFARAAKAATNDVDCMRCEFKQADALASNAKHAEAATMYAAVAERHPDSPLAEHAIFNCANERFAAGQVEDAIATYRKVVERKGPFAPDSMMRIASILVSRGQADDAIAMYNAVLEAYADQSKYAVPARIERGRARYGAYRFDEARSDFESVSTNDLSRADAMRFMIALCLYGSGNDAEAKRTMTKLETTVAPKSALAADVTLWLAKYAFNQGEYDRAQLRFEGYVRDFPKGRQAAEAMVWAAKSAAARAEYSTAVELVTRAIKSYPDSPVLAEGLLVQGESLIELARFDEAAIVLERAQLAAPETDIAKKASILRADAIFALGADDDAKYEAAIKAYRAVLAAEKLSPGERLSISFKIGRAMEKTGDMDGAEDQYYTQVVLAYRDQRAAGVWMDSSAKAFFTRAAFVLADRHESRGNLRQAINILKLVKNANIASSAEADKRIEAIKDKRSIL